jgi:hypothetical protein
VSLACHLCRAESLGTSLRQLWARRAWQDNNSGHGRPGAVRAAGAASSGAVSRWGQGSRSCTSRRGAVSAAGGAQGCRGARPGAYLPCRFGTALALSLIVLLSWACSRLPARSVLQRRGEVMAEDANKVLGMLLPKSTRFTNTGMTSRRW